MPIPLKKELMQSAFLGLIDRPATSGLNPRFVKEALNVDWRGGVASRRLGVRRVNNTALSGTIRQGVYFARFHSGTTERFAAHGASISVVTREPTAITNSLPSDWAALTGGSPTYFQKLNDLIFISNGIDNDTKYNGTVRQKWGISAPGSAPTITEAAGSVSSVRRYVATFVNSATGHEGPPSSQTEEKTLDNENGTVVSPSAPTDPQVDQWRAYAAIVVGGRPGIFYRIGTANIATNLTDNFSDANLKIRNILEEFVNDPPPGPFSLIAQHGGRILAVAASDKSIVYVSDHGGFFSKPESFPVLNYLPINYRGGDEITAIVSFDEYWLAFMKYSIWAVLGNWPDISMKAISYRPDNTSIGTIDQRAVVAFEREVIFPSHDGIYALAKGEGLSEGLFTTNKLSGIIDDFYSAIDLNQLMHASYDRSRRQYRLWCSFRTGQDVHAQ